MPETLLVNYCVRITKHWRILWKFTWKFIFRLLLLTWMFAQAWFWDHHLCLRWWLSLACLIHWSRRSLHLICSYLISNNLFFVFGVILFLFLFGLFETLSIQITYHINFLHFQFMEMNPSGLWGAEHVWMSVLIVKRPGLRLFWRLRMISFRARLR